MEVVQVNGGLQSQRFKQFVTPAIEAIVAESSIVRPPSESGQLWSPNIDI